MAQFVKTLVGRPRHVAIVSGLNRYLYAPLAGKYRTLSSNGISHAAPTAVLSHRVSFLEDVNNRDDTASPESAIRMRALAHKRSTKTYMRGVTMANSDEGIKANRGRRRGAFINS